VEDNHSLRVRNRARYNWTFDRVGLNGLPPGTCIYFVIYGYGRCKFVLNAIMVSDCTFRRFFIMQIRTPAHTHPKKSIGKNLAI